MLLFLIVAPILASLVAACLPTNARNREAWLAGIVALLGLITSLWLYLHIGPGEVLHERIEWFPQVGLDLVFRMDGYTGLFAMLVQGIGFLVVLYARYYMSPKDPVPRFFSFLLAFMAAMLGVVLSGNLIQLVIFWELTSVTSFLLIGYWHHRIDAQRGARMAFTVTATGGLCLLAGILLLGRIVGSYDVDEVLAAGDLVRAHDWYLPTLILIALGALTKSAQFPFHFWLPHAMAAPTPVSSYLHSATMVKAGVFLLTLLWPVLAGTPEWFWLITTTGVCTLLLGSFYAIFQNDLKGLLAYSTISHLGLIVILLGMGSPLAVAAGIFHTLNHAIFKASLFMAAGIIDHETGTRDMRHLRGLYKALPYTATLAIVASASMAGVPLLNGFLSKEMFFAESALVGGQDNWWMSIAAVAMGIFSVAYSLRFISVFFGHLPKDLPQEPHEPARWMRVPVEALVLLCLIVGIVPGWSVEPLLIKAAGAVLQEKTPVIDLAIWHGFSLPLMMSFIALGGGILFFYLLYRFANLRQCDKVPVMHRVKGAEIYDSTLSLLAMAARRNLHFFSTSRLQPQLLVILLALVILSLPIVVWRQPVFPSWNNADLGFTLMWLIGGVCAVTAAWQAKYHRLAALLLLGGTGIVTSLTFLWLSAPDLALTQLVVETVTTVLILLGLRWLPPRLPPKMLNLDIPRHVWLRRSRDMLIALTSGGIMTLISYWVLTRHPSTNLADFFITRALSEGGGSNVVNVLLVDFRAADTLGEITVVAVVALTVYALLRRFRPAPDSATPPSPQTFEMDPASQQTPAQHAETGYLMVPAVYLRFLMPFMVMVSLYFFLRGHNLPGGGFVAGLIFSVTLIVQYMMAGATWVESHFRLQVHNWIAWGLLSGLLTGLGAWVMGYPFLTSHTAHFSLPLLGEIHFPSAFFFDLGVFMVVVGATMLILTTLSHQSIRGSRTPANKTTRSLEGDAL
jgi:multicomponent K+:H+ antiporter subunit A